ncbi:MAG: tryptophan-rich sensory protein [Candidatus Berkelbacteria bacterium]|nr:tryptophan-rich sensory protein [Candidatus Berkelbacteria bacterium]
MNYQKSYTNYKRPPLSPPPYLFGIVWPILYVLIIISYGFVFYQAIKGNISGLLTIPFIINLIANGLFTYFQFKLKNNLLAAIDIVIVLATIILTMILIWPDYHWVTYLQIPYLIWVIFATYLQFGVTILNRDN